MTQKTLLGMSGLVTRRFAGEGVSGYYRFLRRDSQWVWLQSRAAIMYNNKTARAEYIVVINYVINQEEALEEVSAQGRSTDMSLGVFIPPDIPYPKHPPLDNPSFQAMTLANLESNSVSSSSNESFPQDSQMPTYSLDSPASATSSQSLKKPPHTPSSGEGTHPSSPAVLSHPSSSPSLYQPGKIQPSPTIPSYEPSPEFHHSNETPLASDASNSQIRLLPSIPCEEPLMTTNHHRACTHEDIYPSQSLQQHNSCLSTEGLQHSISPSQYYGMTDYVTYPSAQTGTYGGSNIQSLYVEPQRPVAVEQQNELHASYVSAAHAMKPTMAVNPNVRANCSHPTNGIDIVKPSNYGSHDYHLSQCGGVVPPVSAPVSCSQTGGLHHANGLSSPPGPFYPTYPNEDLLKDLEDYIAAEMFTSGSAQMDPVTASAAGPGYVSSTRSS
ncbi:circadian locomoter output cycles protein kaput-like [Corticium candelabrum]|uniref:circadian locomoter output cycles protein kaput-like n=1 Tax=Corticium candelabrum TaxID=121492 RepID=UPI002E2551D5|nr:circadian locomoter output cycles protein kaput-like [Corticium candelabrum]